MTRDEPRPDRGPRVIPGIPGASALGTLALTSGVALTATSGWLIVAASFRPVMPEEAAAQLLAFTPPRHVPATGRVRRRARISAGE